MIVRVEATPLITLTSPSRHGSLVLKEGELYYIGRSTTRTMNRDQPLQQRNLFPVFIGLCAETSAQSSTTSYTSSPSAPLFATDLRPTSPTNQRPPASPSSTSSHRFYAISSGTPTTMHPSLMDTSSNNSGSKPQIGPSIGPCPGLIPAPHFIIYFICSYDVHARTRSITCSRPTI